MLTRQRLRAFFAPGMAVLSRITRHPTLRRLTRRALMGFAALVVGVGGFLAGLYLFGPLQTNAGQTQVNLSVGLDHPGKTVVDIPPLGDRSATTHSGSPIGIDIQVHRLPPPQALATAFQQERLGSFVGTVNVGATPDRFGQYGSLAICLLLGAGIMALTVVQYQRRQRRWAKLAVGLTGWAGITGVIYLGHRLYTAALSPDPISQFAGHIVVAGLIGGFGLSLIFWRLKWRWLTCSAAVTVITLVAVLGSTLMLYKPAALSSKAVDSGYLAIAPGMIGKFKDLPKRLDHANQQLKGALDDTVQPLLRDQPGTSPTKTDGQVAVLHVSDLHLSPYSAAIINFLATQYRVDGIINTGDTGTLGFDFEPATVVEQLPNLDEIARSNGAPVKYGVVKGNHDSPKVMAALAGARGVTVLDGTTMDIGGIRFLGEADPMFTPQAEPGDKKIYDEGIACRVVERTKQDLARTKDVDVLVGHDANMATAAACREQDKPDLYGSMTGLVPLGLYGHVHKHSEVTDLNDQGGTLYLTTGTTGGGGVKKEAPYGASVLFFDPTTHHLVSYVKILIDTDAGNVPVNIQASTCLVDSQNRSSCDPQFKDKGWPLSASAPLPTK